MRLPSKIKMGIYIIAAICLLVSQFQFSETKTVEAASIQKSEPPLTVEPNENLAAPLPAGMPTVSLSVPGNVQIGADFSFTATFSNNTGGATTGFGPFIDLYFPTAGGDSDGDGIDFINATFLGSPVTATVLPFLTTQVTHPYQRDASGNLVTINGAVGDTLVVLELPFGSFTPTQPSATVRVNAHLSNYANMGYDLDIRSRAGFRYGNDALDNWCCDPPLLSPNTNNALAWTAHPVTPTLITITKIYTGPESETATGPNFPRSYTVTVDVPDGQTITNLDVTDTLPDTLQFVTVVDTLVNGSSVSTTAINTPGTTTPGGTLTRRFTSVTGTTGANDVEMIFSFFVPLVDAPPPAPVINPGNGNAVTSINNVSAQGDWTPLDPDDTGGIGNASANCPTCHTLNDRSLATQKYVEVLSGDDNPTPGGTPNRNVLVYTIDFQVSDFFAFQNLHLTDIISDGQHFDSSFSPRLSINGNNFVLATAGMNSNNVNVTCNYTGGPGLECDADDGAANTGETTIDFNVSAEMISQGLSNSSGRLVGGCIPFDVASGNGGLTFPNPDAVLNCDPGNGGYNDGATTGTITFQTIVQDQFTDINQPPYAPPNSTDASVDHGDILRDTVTIRGDLLDVTDLSPIAVPPVEDTSSANISIAFGVLSKTIYAFGTWPTTACSPQPCTSVQVKPGDTVTYRLTYSLPTSDFENVILTDYLPLPVFDATEITTFNDVISATPPLAGHAKFGPAETFRSTFGPGVGIPLMTASAGGNSVAFDYGDFDDPGNVDTVMDLLFTVTVSDEPFTDGLFLTNQARAAEGTTNAGNQILDNIIQIELNEPFLIFRKGVIATDAATPTFSPSTTGPVAFNGAGTPGAPWAGSFDSLALAAAPIDSNLDGVDAGDLVRFALVIENQGHSPSGAFDIVVRDSPDTGFVPMPLNLRVTRGDGTNVSFTNVGSGLFDPSGGIELTDPGTVGICEGHSDTSGTNIIVVTYDLRVAPGILPDQIITNTGELVDYASTEGGPDFIPDGSEPYDTSDVIVRNVAPAKSIVSSSEGHTSESGDGSAGNPRELAIGEIARYQLAVTLPEGTSSNFQVVDTLPSGFTFIDNGTGTAKLSFIADQAMGLPVDLLGADNDALPPTIDVPVSRIGLAGQVVTFNLGTLVNNDSDVGEETVVIEFNVLVNNTADTNNTDLKNNNFEVFINGASHGTSNTIGTLIREPLILFNSGVNQKVANPTTGDSGDTITYTLTLTADSARVDAFNVVVRDDLSTLPVNNLTFLSATPTGCTNPGTISNTVLAGVLTVTVEHMSPGCRIDVQYTADLTVAVTPGQVVTNTANITYTSLPGTNGTTSNPTGSSTPGASGTSTGERNGTLPPIVAPNDYHTSDTATVTVTSLASNKTIIATSEGHTSEANAGSGADPRLLAVGEVIRYRLVLQIPEGTTYDLQLRDRMTANGGELTYIDDGTARVRFVADTGMTSSDYGAGAGLVSGITCPILTGTFNLAAAGDPGIIPTSAINCTFADNNISNNEADDTDTYSGNTDVFFKVGTITNTDNEPLTPNNEYVIVEFNAIADNAGGANSNDGGDTPTNTIQGRRRLTLLSGLANNGGNSTRTVRILEPSITNLAKSATPASGDAGDTITYQLTFSNANGTDNTTAFGVHLIDTVPAKMTANLGSNGANITVSSAGNCATGIDRSASSGNNVDIAVSTVPAGCAVTVTYTATLNTSVTPEEVLANTANITYTSLPGSNGTTSNPTGSSTPGASGTDTGERDGSNGALAWNDYHDVYNADVTVPGVVVTKQIITTSASHTTGSDLAIGEEVTFAILLTFPEGTTPADTLLDDLPSGLELVGGSPQVISTAAASGGLLTTDFSGTVGIQTITPTLGDGGQVQFAFTNVVVAGDNDTTNNTLLLKFDARLTNILSNQAGTNISNVATNQVGTNPVTTSNTVTVTVVEPSITFSKSIVALPSPLDAGGVVHYRISYANGTGATVSTAMDVHITDALAAVLLLPSTSTPDLVITPTAGVGAITNNSTTTSIDITIASVPPGESVTIDFYPIIQSDITPSQVIDNIGNSTWTSLSGTPTGERDGSGTPAVNDYHATDNVSFTNPGSVTITKQLVSTSASHTSGSDLTIGEILTYGILLTFPEGTTSSDQVVDDLPGGLIVVGTPEIVTLAADSGGLLTADFNGSLGTQNVTIDASDGGSVTYDFAQDTTNIVVAGDNDTTNNTILLRFQVRVTDVGGNIGFPVATVISNSATNQVGSGTPTSSNSVDVTVVEPRPILTKSFANVTTPASGASGILGDVIRMTLTYENTGTSNAYDVVITDALDSTRIASITSITTPAGFTYSTSGTNPITVQYAADAGTAIAPGATVVFELDFTLTSANVPGDVIPNTANVTQTTTLDSSTSDGDDANERNTTTNASANLQFNGVELAITKDDGGVTTSPGSNLTYTLNYNNYGNIDATNVILTEVVPLYTRFISANNPSLWYCGINPAPAGTNCTINVGSLAQGANGSITFVLTVDTPFPASVTEISNTASIDSDQPETVDTDNSASDTTPVNAAPALTITKDDHIQIVAPGFQVTYDIRVTNSGNQDLVNLELVDTIPAGTSFISASGSGSYNGGTGEVSWPWFDLDAGDFVDFTLTLQVATAADLTGITSFPNTIHVQDDGTNTTGTPVEAQATDTDQLAILNVKSLTGSNQPGSAMPNVLIGEILDYAVRIDIPVGTITSLKAVDILDHGLAFVGCNPSSPISSGTLVLAQNPCTTPSALTVQAEPITDLNPNSDDAGRHITFDFGQVENNSGSTQTLIVNYQVIVLDIQDNVDGLTGLSNTVEWQWEGGTLSGFASGVDVVEPDLSIAKTVDPVIAALGSVVTYTIEISHTAESTAPAYDALMTDGIPTGLELVPGSVTVTGSAGLPAATITESSTRFSVFWTSFPVGETATIIFEARFIGPSPVINTANVEWASIQIDPSPPLVPQSPYNVHSTERRYDPLSQAINDYRASSSISLRQPELPATGFAPGVQTIVSAQPRDKMYNTLGDMWLEIQALDLKLPIVGVPATSDGNSWDITWLGKNAGWLNGTAFPTWKGNSVITSHVYLPNGQPGPFVDLSTLKFGDRVIVSAYGQDYIYEVRTVKTVKPDDTSRVIRHEELPWITLLTCKDYDPRTDTYLNRIAVRAVLVSVIEK
jgi:large repetitive protein